MLVSVSPSEQISYEQSHSCKKINQKKTKPQHYLKTRLNLTCLLRFQWIWMKWENEWYTCVLLKVYSLKVCWSESIVSTAFFPPSLIRSLTQYLLVGHHKNRWMSLVEAYKKTATQTNYFTQNYTTDARDWILTIPSSLILKYKALVCNIWFLVTFGSLSKYLGVFFSHHKVFFFISKIQINVICYFRLYNIKCYLVQLHARKLAH